MEAKTLAVEMKISDHGQDEEIDKATDNGPHQLLCQFLEKGAELTCARMCVCDYNFEEE